ncbi:MAG: hypothetical protein NTU49_09580 [Gammaproteobacteria bacterium]|nr:hypothetical protein [Gammaproteobacteria bacterium]
MSSVKKTTYFFIVFLISGLFVLFYSLFFTTEKPATPDHTALTLQPFTLAEKKDLIRAQQAQEPVINAGPLVATMNAPDAEAKVLNLNHNIKAPA